MSRKELASRMMTVLVRSKVGSLLSMKMYYSGSMVNSMYVKTWGMKSFGVDSDSTPRVKKKLGLEGIKVHYFPCITGV